MGTFGLHGRPTKPMGAAIIACRLDALQVIEFMTKNDVEPVKRIQRVGGCPRGLQGTLFGFLLQLSLCVCAWSPTAAEGTQTDGEQQRGAGVGRDFHQEL